MRRTIARPARVAGVGLHLGVPCTLEFRPATAGTGVRFQRTDLAGAAPIPARAEHAVLTERRTQLGEEPNAVHTVEHVLAAVHALELDDLVISMDGPEPPIMDGSAGPFFEALRGAGVVEQVGGVPVGRVTAPVRLVDGESVYEAVPADGLSLDVTIDFPHALIGRQQYASDVTAERFARELAWARTFGFVQEVEPLRARGLIKGASTQNAVVLDAAGVVENALRSPDEFVRHKMMDCVGDLALAGVRLKARIVAHKPSHRGTVLFVRALQASMKQEIQVLGIEEIMKVLPHRYPFLLVDRVLELEPQKRVVGIKNVTINEPFFAGHFPGHPIMPGVLIVEAMAQVGGMLLLGAIPDPESKVVYFTSLNNVKWRRPVKPGDQLRFELEMLQVRGMMCKMQGVARVDGEVVCEAEMSAMVRDR
ncbi:MAG: bifunctional UDP-3-O-[3-hydroxymyristoyl] N-acetylglucosamine deacetylase/3-hydroxyacyl-ACP dehydratase [Gemmatimonadaceae bacterium]|nr:bifunctional UDP-3-O-[3-hydroxymyristoyl] N-acetylglucosamine deacetylase/3-hydroxyacyl-ACP dehydratase [Gemmatimonadaceae bacterium]NUR34753.1 bifunctional UDP-3-O-[3-hydroxymyristoyl] N-acetylglucosamine deacetylase/3-hydroxyacyl-ACP dehydratase [Gemmatimonadaceae bacterium]NUS33248.1 bifunctional UDP-3-O-[3-hydroxymyristoyl] N-acetylglucosamine deacetylase/3-hydroxyacyl-ACP dehydratase [Gemmatimonadaceae bacterium]